MHFPLSEGQTWSKGFSQSAALLRWHYTFYVYGGEKGNEADFGLKTCIFIGFLGFLTRNEAAAELHNRKERREHEKQSATTRRREGFYPQISQMHADVIYRVEV